MKFSEKDLLLDVVQRKLSRNTRKLKKVLTELEALESERTLLLQEKARAEAWTEER
jgi:hypothetical protein